MSDTPKEGVSKSSLMDVDHPEETEKRRKTSLSPSEEVGAEISALAIATDPGKVGESGNVDEVTLNKAAGESGFNIDLADDGLVVEEEIDGDTTDDEEEEKENEDGKENGKEPMEESEFESKDAVDTDAGVNGAAEDVLLANPLFASQGNGQACGGNCFLEKGILINEIERLRSAVFELSERQSLVEDFIEVEFATSFETYMKRRQHLIDMGFSNGNEQGTVVDGKKKSSELVELLKMIKEQAVANESSESKPDDKGNNKSSPEKEKENKNNANNRNQHQSGSDRKPHQKSKQSSYSMSMAPPPKSYSQQGRGGTQSYFQRAVPAPPILSQNPHSLTAAEYQYQQQVLASRQSGALLQAAQSRYYYDSMYSNVMGGGAAKNREPEYVVAIGRSGLSAKPYPTGSGYRRTSPKKSGGSPSDSKLTNRERKRKRESEVSSDASGTTSVQGQNETLVKNPLAIQKAVAPEGANKSTGGEGDPKTNLNPSSKRVCPECTKVVNKKGLRDHLIVMHKGFKIKCRDCDEEFYQRRRLKLHMRDIHDIPASEYSLYITNLYSSFEVECGLWLDEMMKNVTIPTKEQMIEYHKEMAILAVAGKTDNDNEGEETETKINTSSVAAQPQSVSKQGTKTTVQQGQGPSNTTKAKSASVKPILSSTTPTARGNGSTPTTPDSYGPGGYAAYAAKHLAANRASNI